MKFYTANYETGMKIEGFDTFEEALDALLEYEEDDKNEGIYEHNFYSIIDDEGETVYTVVTGRIK